MAKILAWLVLIFVVLLALRMINMRKSRTKSRGTGPAPAPDAQPMVRCSRCGVFLPRNDASPVAGGYTCPDNACVKQ